MSVGDLSPDLSSSQHKLRIFLGIHSYALIGYPSAHFMRSVLHLCVYHHHNHHIVPLAWISLPLSRHFSLSLIASVRSSGLHPVSSHSCCMYALAGRPAFPRPYVGIHRSTSLMSSSLLLQQCPACLVRQTWIAFVCLEYPSIKSKKTASGWQRKEAEGTPQKQLPKPTTLMT